MSRSEVVADLALAQALQEQERAYMLLRMGSEGSEFESSGSGSGRYDYDGDGLEAPGDEDEDEADEGEEEEEEEEEEEDNAEEVELVERRVNTEGDIDGSLFDSDEAFARALQDKEDRDTTAQLMALAGIHDFEGDYESDSNDSQDMWQDVDPDNMSYEELMALGEAVGTESKGLSAQAIAALPGSSYVPDHQESTCGQEQCVICRHEYEEGDSMLTLPCKHQYHSDCIQQWLQINKVCPVCSAEVSLPGSNNSNPSS